MTVERVELGKNGLLPQRLYHAALGLFSLLEFGSDKVASNLSAVSNHYSVLFVLFID
jgi:hypothetical protein